MKYSMLGWNNSSCIGFGFLFLLDQITLDFTIGTVTQLFIFHLDESSFLLSLYRQHYKRSTKTLQCIHDSPSCKERFHFAIGQQFLQYPQRRHHSCLSPAVASWSRNLSWSTGEFSNKTVCLTMNRKKLFCIIKQFGFCSVNSPTDKNLIP